MAVSNAMFIFEVVVESVQSLVESRVLIIRSDFADVFSLELKDPKQMHITMPEPPPLPPEPAGKGKKKKPPPKKKGKKGKVEEPPPEPVIQSGQSVLFTSTAEFLIQNMLKFPLEVSLWSKEDNFVFIGASLIPWDPIFTTYLSKIANEEVPAPVTVRDDYNVFEEGTAKLMAKLGIQVKLSFLGDKVCTAFRTLSEDPTVKKCLYTGINSKGTSYICTMKTTDEDFVENSNKVENNFVVDKPKPPGKIVYADYKNAPGANLTFFNDGDYCCMGHADKPPESIYKSPEVCPDVDFIIDYVRKIIVSCNDNMRMLTPRPTISPRVKATDIDRLCYCKETSWPDGKFAERFKKEAQSGSCPLCIDAGAKAEASRAGTFDIANIRGPCGKPDCRIARDLRAYIENLVEEDNKEFNLEDLIGPCGSKACTLTEKIQEFLRHEGVFSGVSTLEGLSTQCACIQTMQKALEAKQSCHSICSKECKESDSDATTCEGKECPFLKQKVYNVYYFTVIHDFEKSSVGTSSENDDKSSTYKYCSTNCPSMKDSEKTTCSKSACSNLADKNEDDFEESDSKCQMPVCPDKQDKYDASPADSDIMISFKDIHNPCCVKTCDVADKVKDFLVDASMSKKHIVARDEDDPCYCDCVCSFKFTKKSTYCPICGGYECLGDDMVNEPEYAKPHPCPVYHKLYDKKYIKTPNPWAQEEEKKKQQGDSTSTKSSRTASATKARRQSVDRRLITTNSHSSRSIIKRSDENKVKKVKKEKKKVGKFTANVEEKSEEQLVKKPEPKYPYPPVPKNMGWNWTAEDIPGLKMVFKYKRKSNRAAWSEETLDSAVRAVKDDGKSINSTAKKYGIPFTTLQRHVRSGNKSKKLGRFTAVFSPEQEEELCSYLKKLGSLFFGLTRSDFLELVFDYASRNNISHPFKNGKAGDDWFSGFKRRHPEIVLRAPEPTSLARTRGFNRPQVELFYSNYWSLIEKHNFDATTIYNMDETGIKTSTTKPPKVLSIRGKRQVGVICSAERGQLTTVICCCNAAGTFVPPFFIFARKRMQERLLDNAPPGSHATVTDNGWIHGEAFMNWLQFFVDKVRPSETRKVLLLLDNHESHKYYPALEFATKNHIVFLSFAPHTTDRMQPLDVAVYGPLKKYFEQELNTFQKMHPGRIVNQYDMAKLFGGAYAKSASVQNAVNGFKKPGIWPYDPNVFGDEDYAPSTMTDRPFHDVSSIATNLPVNDAPPIIADSPFNGPSSTMTDCPLNQSPIMTADPLLRDTASVTAKEPEAEFLKQPVIIPEIGTERSTTPFLNSTTLHDPDILLRGSANSVGENYLAPATLTSLTPLQIRPIPAMAAPKTDRRHKRQKSEVLTSTPVKAEQAIKYEKANVKKTKITEIAGPNKTKNKKSTVKPQKKIPKPDFYCLVCADKYTEPPAEDWIQCNQCKSWAHEDCTSYVGVGSYFCDECED